MEVLSKQELQLVLVPCVELELVALGEAEQALVPYNRQLSVVLHEGVEVQHQGVQRFPGQSVLFVDECNNITIGCVPLPKRFDLIFNVSLHVRPNMITHNNLIMLYLSCDLFLCGLLL
jgi:hypothetical protein